MDGVHEEVGVGADKAAVGGEGGIAEDDDAGGLDLDVDAGDGAAFDGDGDGHGAGDVDLGVETRGGVVGVELDRKSVV